MVCSIRRSSSSSHCRASKAGERSHSRTLDDIDTSLQAQSQILISLCFEIKQANSFPPRFISISLRLNRSSLLQSSIIAGVECDQLTSKISNNFTRTVRYRVINSTDSSSSFAKIPSLLGDRLTIPFLWLVVRMKLVKLICHFAPLDRRI